MNPDDLLAKTFIEKYPIDAARLIESMKSKVAADFLVTLPSEAVARMLQHVLPHAGLLILEHMPEKTVIEILSYMSTTSVISILRQSEPSWQVGILGKLDTKSHASTLKAFSFPDQSAGRFADPHVLLFTADRTVSDAILWVQQQPGYDTDDLFILDRQHHLIGRVTMRGLLISDPDTRIEKVMDRHVNTLPADRSLEEIRHSPYWQASTTLPVVDDTQTFLGVIRYHSLFATMRTEEAPKSSSHSQVTSPATHHAATSGTESKDQPPNHSDPPHPSNS